jgi:hypothetical protein
MRFKGLICQFFGGYNDFCTYLVKIIFPSNNLPIAVIVELFQSVFDISGTPFYLIKLFFTLLLQVLNLLLSLNHCLFICFNKG